MADLFKCQNCGHVEDHDTLPVAQDISYRLNPGDIFTDVECPECGALCLPVKEDEDAKA